MIKSDLIDRNEYLNELLSSFVVRCYELKVIEYNYNLISFDNVELFTINKDAMYGDKSLQIRYANILEELASYYYIDLTLSLSNTLLVNYNTIFSFVKNRDMYIIDKTHVAKRAIYGVNKLLNQLDKISIDTKLNSVNGVNVLIPVLFQIDSDKINHLFRWITLINKETKLNRVILVSIFCINTTDQTLKQKICDFNQDSGINVIYFPLVDNVTFFDILKNKNIIDNELHKKISMFISQPCNTPDISRKMIQNPLFLKWTEIMNSKQSRICLNIESVSSSEELIRYTNLLGPYISAIKLNSNFIFNESILSGLKRLATHHNFIIIDDKQIRLRSMDDLKQINIFKYVDIVSVTFDFISEDIVPWFQTQRHEVNKFASFVINFRDIRTNIEKEVAKKQYLYFNNLVSGIIGVSETDDDLFSIVDYSEINRLNDNFKALKQSDIIVLGDELYKAKNPIDVIQKINTIMCSK